MFYFALIIPDFDQILQEALRKIKCSRYMISMLEVS